MPDLERDLRAARPDWPEPGSAATVRARAALGLEAAPRSTRGWLGRATRGRGTRLLVPAALLLTAGAAVAATIISGGGGQGPVPGRPASLTFGPPQVVGQPVGSFDAGPAVAVDGAGTVTVAWARAGRVVVSARPRGGTWSPPERVSDPARRAALPRVGVDRAGNLTVSWRERTAAERVVREFTLPSGAPAGTLERLTGQRWAVVARTRMSGAAWLDPVRLSDDTASPRDIEEPGLVVAPGGLTVVTWDAGDATWSRVRSAGGDWGPVVRVGSDAGEAVDPRLAAAPSGTAILIWSNRLTDGGDRRYAIRAAIADDAGRWAEPALIDARAVNPPNAAGALNDRGEAVVSWISEGAVATSTSAAVRSADGAWSDPAVVSTDPGLFGLRGNPGMDAGGRAIVVSGPRGVAVGRTPGGDWGPLALSPVTGRSFGLVTFTDAVGDVVVVRGADDPARLLVERPGGDPGSVPMSGRAPAAAAGADGTAVLAWASGGRPARVVVAVAEGPR